MDTKGILDRKKLTDVWKENGIKQNYEYAILTNEIYQSWSGMKASEYKGYKNIKKSHYEIIWQSRKAKAFAEYWKNKGYEKGQIQ